MAQQNDFTVLHKQVFADGIQNLVPSFAKLSKEIKFSKEKQTGRYYEQPVQMSLEHGFSYTNNSVVTLNTEIAAGFLEAQVDGKEIILQTSVPHLQAAKMTSSARAFAKAATVIYESMLASAHKRLEIGILYGQSAQGVGEVLTNTAGALVLTVASWSTGIWSGMKNAVLEAFTSGGVQHNTDLVITDVNVSARQITVSGTSAAVVAGDLLFFKGSRVADMVGLEKIITNTGSLYNISAATEELWKGNSYSAGSAALNGAKILAAAALAAGRGCAEDLVCVVSNATFGNLAADAAALRVYDGSSRPSGENGADKLAFYGPSGKVEVMAHMFCKDGEAFIFPPKHCMRIGSSDVEFKIPGAGPSEGDMDLWFIDPTTNAQKIRLYSHQTVFVDMPAFTVKITAIVNS
jgi:hypothetical protein